MERKRLGRNLRLYLLGQMVSLAGLVGMALALIPLLSSLVNAETFRKVVQAVIVLAGILCLGRAIL